MSITIGTDYEVPLVDQTGNFVAANDLIGGTKHNPVWFYPWGNLQEDNVMGECATIETSSVSQFKERIKALNEQLDEIISRYSLKVARYSAAEYPENQLLHPAAREAGCEPDYNAWTKRINPRPNLLRSSLRSAGGHISVGWEHSGEEQWWMGQWMDIYVGAFLTQWDKEERRRALYGKAGAMRPKPFGTEYRNPSNWWVFSEDRIDWIWERTHLAHEAMMQYGSPVEVFGEKVRDYIQVAINNSNKKMLDRFLSHAHEKLGNIATIDLGGENAR